MTERERWIVYPLLFLALGAALRDKLFDRTTSKSIICQDVICQELTVVDAEPFGNRPVNILAQVGRTETSSGRKSSGLFKLNGQLDVNGVVNARQYAFRDVPFVPALPMGVSWPELFRAAQHAAQVQQQTDQSTSQQSQTPPAEPSPAAKPLADPDDNR